MKLYEKMPLIEPLEYQQAMRIKDFVIAIDTSASTSGKLVQKFVQKTYNILKSTESFFSQINLYIIQCDSAIQEVVHINSQEDFDNYLKTMKIRGQGGTDFRPVFAYVDELIKKKLLSDKVYEQSIGFLRIPDGINPLDKTGIHPESYDVTNNLLSKLSLDIKDINNQEFKDTLSKQNALKLSEELNSDIYTIQDIIKELLNPGLDPRDELEAPILKSDILHIEDLKIGMELQGTVRNVASFGAFIDIGLHDDGLVHISKMSKSFVKNPNDIVHVGDIVTCYVADIDLVKQKVQLSLIKNV